MFKFLQKPEEATPEVTATIECIKEKLRDWNSAQEDYEYSKLLSSGRTELRKIK